MTALMAAAGAAAVLALGGGTALAHVSVEPGQAVLRDSTEFTITVPAEDGLATNSVSVDFPAQVRVHAVADAPGWSTRIIRRPDGRLRGAEWTGGRIPPGQYATFTVLGTPVATGTSVWRSEQGLANGQVKRWTAQPEADDAEAGEAAPGVVGPAWAVEIAAEPSAAGSGGSSAWPGVIGIALGALALVGVGLLWSSRPGNLPPDGPEDGPGR